MIEVGIIYNGGRGASSPSSTTILHQARQDENIFEGFILPTTELRWERW